MHSEQARKEDRPSSPAVVRYSRKELDQLVIAAWAREAVVAAAERAAMLAPEYAKQSIMRSLTLCGRTIAAMLHEGDDPILLVPGWIVRNGAEQTGAILTIKTGAIFAWTERRLRLTYFGRSVLQKDVISVGTPPPPHDYNATLRVVTSTEPITVHFATVRNSDGPTGFLDSIVTSVRVELDSGVRTPGGQEVEADGNDEYSLT
jgi:hypothetical protein